MDVETAIWALVEHIKECNWWWKDAYRDGSADRMATNENRRIAYLVSIGTLLLVNEDESVNTASALWRAGEWFEAHNINQHNIV